MMTPQQLIDLPFYGMAEKELRKAGKWRRDKSEVLLNDLEEALCSLSDAKEYIENAMEAK